MQVRDVVSTVLSCGAALVLSGVLVSAQTPQTPPSQTPPSQTPASQTPAQKPPAEKPAMQHPPMQHPPAAGAQKPSAEMEAKCKAMMAEREKMMANRKAADQKLDTLVATMNAASGAAKADATAAVVNELISQRKTMHESMMKMQHAGMMHMGEHMQAGAGSMAMCPMMKMGGMKR